MDSNDNLQIKALVKETVMLFIILGACRKQALVTLTFDNIIFKENKVICFRKNHETHEVKYTIRALICHHYPETIIYILLIV